LKHSANWAYSLFSGTLRRSRFFIREIIDLRGLNKPLADLNLMIMFIVQITAETANAIRNTQKVEAAAVDVG